MTETEMPLATGQEYDDGSFVVLRWEAYSHHLAFEAKEGTRQDDGSFFYMHFVLNVSEPTESFEEGDQLVRGSVKWDGCSHVHFGAKDEQGYVHLCGASGYRGLFWALSTAFHLAQVHIPNWYADCAGVLP